MKGNKGQGHRCALGQSFGWWKDDVVYHLLCKNATLMQEFPLFATIHKITGKNNSRLVVES
jgi:hypothetical protein